MAGASLCAERRVLDSLTAPSAQGYCYLEGVGAEAQGSPQGQVRWNPRTVLMSPQLPGAPSPSPQPPTRGCDPGIWATWGNLQWE